MKSLPLLIFAASLLAVSSCSPEAPKPGATPQVAQVKAPAVSMMPEGTTSAKAEDEKPPPFVYDPQGLRDPFAPFIKIETTKQKQKPKVFVPKTPLQRYAVEELRVVGVIWADAGKAKALIEDPEGKGYVVGIGTLVGDQEGKIIQIHPEQVVVEERFFDLLGEENVKVVKMALHKPEGEVNP